MPHFRARVVAKPRQYWLVFPLAFFMLSAFALLWPQLGQAESALPAPTGKVILTVKGNINVTNGDGMARFDRAMFESLGMETLTTSNPWLVSDGVFEGVRISRVLEAVGANSQRFLGVALNDYAAEVYDIDFDKYPVMLASKLDGSNMSVRDKGPLWIVFPLSEYPDLDSSKTRSMSVWQLSTIEVH